MALRTVQQRQQQDDPPTKPTHHSDHDTFALCTHDSFRVKQLSSIRNPAPLKKRPLAPLRPGAAPAVRPNMNQTPPEARLFFPPRRGGGGQLPRMHGEDRGDGSDAEAAGQRAVLKKLEELRAMLQQKLRETPGSPNSLRQRALDAPYDLSIQYLARSRVNTEVAVARAVGIEQHVAKQAADNLFLDIYQPEVEAALPSCRARLQRDSAACDSMIARTVHLNTSPAFIRMMLSAVEARMPRLRAEVAKRNENKNDGDELSADLTAQELQHLSSCVDHWAVSTSQGKKRNLATPPPAIASPPESLCATSACSSPADPWLSCRHDLLPGLDHDPFAVWKAQRRAARESFPAL